MLLNIGRAKTATQRSFQKEHGMGQLQDVIRLMYRDRDDKIGGKLLQRKYLSKVR